MSQCFTVILFEHYCLWRREIIDVERGWLGGGDWPCYTGETYLRQDDTQKMKVMFYN